MIENQEQFTNTENDLEDSESIPVDIEAEELEYQVEVGLSDQEIKGPFYDAIEKCFKHSNLISDNIDICVLVERVVIPDSDNYQYMVTVKDNVTNAKATANINESGNIVKELINAGCVDLSTLFNQKCFISTIKYAVKEAVKHPEYTTNRHWVVGWKEISGDDCYFGNRVVFNSNPIRILESEFDNPDIVNMSRSGTLNGWIEAVHMFIAPLPIPSIVIAAAFAGILRQRYKSLTKDTLEVISLIGESSIGKTTIVRAATTVFTSETEYLGYSATLSSRIKRLTARNPIVASIDDIMQMGELVDLREGNKKAAKLREIIFSLASGTGKDRLGRYGTLNRIETFDSTILVTSVESLLDKTGEDVGQYSRIIEFNLNNDDLAPDAETSRRMVSMMEENHGWAAEEFAKKLLEAEHQAGGKKQFEEILFNRYEDIRKSIVADIDEDEYESDNQGDLIKSVIGGQNIFKSRMANRPALIILIAELLNEIWDIDFDIDEITDCLIANANTVIEYIEREKEGIQQNNNFDLAINNLANYFNKYKIYFSSETLTSKDDLSHYLGIYNYDAEGNLEIIIPASRSYSYLPYIINEIEPDVIFKIDMSMPVPAKYNISAIINQWIDAGILLVDSGRKNKRETIISGKQNMRAYHIVISKDLLTDEVNHGA